MSILKGRGKRKIPQKNLRSADLDRRLVDRNYGGYYMLANGDVVEIHDYEGIGDDEEYIDSQENDPPETRIEGGVYYTDQYGEGGIMPYTRDDTLGDFVDSGFLSAGIKGLLTNSGESHRAMDDVFSDYDIDDEERNRRLRDVISRFSLMNRRRR